MKCFVPSCVKDDKWMLFTFKLFAKNHEYHKVIFDLCHSGSLLNVFL